MLQRADAPDTATEDFARTYARFASGLDFADIPETTLKAAQVNLADTLACSIAGFKAEGAVEVRELVQDWGGAPQARVLWTDMRVPAPNAAWINGVMSHARDYDDVHDKAIVHAGVSGVPAAIAAAEAAGRPVSGRDFFAGLTAGLEMTLRMGVATNIGVIDAGFIFTSLMGYFGATAAASRISGLDEEQTHNALGITYSQAAGGHQVTRDAAWTKRIQPGFAARAALTSVAMTRKGVRGARSIFEGEDGLWKIYLRGELSPEKLREGLGARYHLDDLCYKPYPSCRYNHTAIDAALDMRAQPGFDWRKVKEIRAYATEQFVQAVGTPLAVRQAPETLVQAQFSVCYNVACALVQGTVGLSDFATPEALRRPDIRALTAKLTPLVDAEIEAKWGRSMCPTRLEAVLGDGSVYSAWNEHPLGSQEKPFSAQDRRNKLTDCLQYGGFDPAVADRFDEILGNLPDSRDVAADFARLSDLVRGA